MAEREPILDRSPFPLSPALYREEFWQWARDLNIEDKEQLIEELALWEYSVPSDWVDRNEIRTKVTELIGELLPPKKPNLQNPFSGLSDYRRASLVMMMIQYEHDELRNK